MSQRRTRSVRGALLRTSVTALALCASMPSAAWALDEGALTSDGCLGRSGNTTCDAVSGATKGQAPGLDAPDDVAVSPDGNYVYATGSGAGAIAVLQRDPGTGALTSDGCLRDSGNAACDAVAGATTGQAPGLGDPRGVAVSPDGAYVYAVSFAASALAVLKRNPTTGALTGDGCLRNTGNALCDAVAGATHGQAPGLGGSFGVAVSPDGEYVYATGFNSNTIAVLRRDAGTGALTSDGCLRSSGNTGCDAVAGATQGQAPGLEGAYGVAVSPDGDYVYVAGFNSNTVAVLKRNADTGALTSDGCLRNSGNAGCDAVAGTTKGQAPGLAGAQGIAVSPDGNYVYVTGRGSNAIAVLKRDPGTGALTSDGCLRNTASAGCDAVEGATSGQASGLISPQDVAVSPDGRYVYVTGSNSNTVAVLKRNVDTGALTSDGCLRNSGNTGCDAVSGATQGQAPGLAAPAGIAVSPDNHYVYAAGGMSNAVAVLERFFFVAPADSDGDGVPDNTDFCPTAAGPASSNGCPQSAPADSDGDGFFDSADSCPGVAGPASSNGCPAGISDACAAATAKLERARAKLKALKEKDAPAKRIKKVKAKVKKLKAVVQGACR